jgi:predicted dehydrogenase
MTVRVAVLGAGVRGWEHSRRIRRVGGVITAVAEPVGRRRDRLAAEHGVAAENCVDHWRDLLSRTDLFDAVLITTQDGDHAEPCVRFADLGRHVLCEKPMAPTEPDAARMVDAVTRAGVVFAVLHPLRYMPSTDVIKDLVRDGRIGDVVSVQNLEPVGAWHFAHSYVRGNWRREDQSSSLLMAKCCHDLDWLSYLIESQPARVSSFGRLTHFTAANRPDGAADRCLDCSVEADCPFSAVRIYGSCLGDREREHWPLGVVTPVRTEQSLRQALADGPYGRCVYACDNDVVDHQVVALDYANGVTATHTVTAFTEMDHRQTRVFGTHGYLESDGHRVVLHDFRAHPAAQVTVFDVADPALAERGVVDHGDGDFAAIAAFLHAVDTGDTSRIRSGPRESLDSHRAVWAAEQSRLSGDTVALL